jgi:hypothetical protein
MYLRNKIEITRMSEEVGAYYIGTLQQLVATVGCNNISVAVVK